ncbi:hypothetical protein Nepgr_005543 [Nepenthes gracilis]|uniref:GATA transcription factor n=1 Tax=Nepenthes gracilis TaxID=150966 RepID=A0AAD3XGF9_NEPGR|nr:hypothetical protein Nepgr_005543 [Nepenthes gracilis]
MEAPDFLVEGLLDLTHGDDVMPDAFFDALAGHSTDSSNVTAVDSCNCSVSGIGANSVADFPCGNIADAHFSGELCVPCDDLAELEWLSYFVEESFSTEDLRNLQLISGPPSNGPAQARQFESDRPNPAFKPETTVPGKARSKLSRVAPSDWSTRLLMVSHTTSPSESHAAGGLKRPLTSKKRENATENSNGHQLRRCLHCGADKTPQWRTGPMGPKTLCNACGVRYKSGRLMPEYRPAASPTFVPVKHSNSHRKVLELRKQKELKMQQQQQQFLSPNFGVSGVSIGDDCLIHHHSGADYRQLI